MSLQCDSRMSVNYAISRKGFFGHCIEILDIPIKLPLKTISKSCAFHMFASLTLLFTVYRELQGGSVFCKFVNKDRIHYVLICYNQLPCLCYITMKHETAYFLQLIEVQHDPTCWLKMESVISTTKD